MNRHALKCAALIFSMTVSLASRDLQAASRALLDQYAHKDTQALVTQVEDAADLVERTGLSALNLFRQPGSRWYPHNDDYLFVYSLDGTCLFNPAVPQLVGRQMLNLEDSNRRRPVARMIEIASNPDRHARGWAFYLWARGDQISATWKSSYIRKAILPDGRVVAIGAGSYTIKIEQKFLEDAVLSAADIIERRGPDEAFAEIANERSPINFAEVRLFVLDENGKSLVDPTFPNLGGRDFRAVHDGANNMPVKDILLKLKSNDTATAQYLQRKPGVEVLARKYLHVRRAQWHGQTFIVGGEYFLPVPIWMGE